MNKAERTKLINRYGAHGGAILEANHRSKLQDLAWACALVEQESDFKNVFGCDYGPQSGHPPFCEDRVTHKRVQELLAQSKNNGVGLTQLTDRSLVEQAERMGGAHISLNQCIVGFKLLKQIIDSYGHAGIWHYNGAPAYQQQIQAKYDVWVKRLK